MNPKDLVGAKKAPLRYVPPALMLSAARAMENGALKYGPFNWRDQPIEVIGYIEAVIRHLFAYLDGQDDAEDSGIPHIDHAIAGLGIVADATALGNLIDNRFTPGPASDMLRALDKSAPPQVGSVDKVTVSDWQYTIPEDSEPAGLPLRRNFGPLGPGHIFFDESRVNFNSNFMDNDSDDGPDLDVTMRGLWPPDTRIGGYLTCCGASEHTLECPQWR